MLSRHKIKNFMYKNHQLLSRNFSLISLKSSDELSKLVDEAGNKLITLQYTAKWCGPCQQIAPLIDDLSTELADTVDFLKIDVDELNELASEANITSVPTFHLIKNGELVDNISGADINKLKESIENHSTSSS